jgi:hypothetical protein
MPVTLDRPLVFGAIPSVILNRDCISRFIQFFKTRHVHFEAVHFQHDVNFHLVRFPSLTAELVEDLLDQCTRRYD